MPRAAGAAGGHENARIRADQWNEHRIGVKRIVVDEASIALQESEAKPLREARALTEADAVEIWIARWLRIRRKDLMAQYGCDSRRLYEIWWGEKFPSARDKAAKLFKDRYPGLVDRTALGYRRIPRRAPTTVVELQRSFDFDR